MDPIANFLTALRNANRKRLEKVDVPYSKIKVSIAKILKEEGYIQAYRMMEENQRPFLRVQLRYTDTREPIIQDIQRVSRPGLRIYEGCKDMKKVAGGMGVAILTTSKGLLTQKKAKAMKVGGEVLCHVW